jgi:hypothetical protein
VPWFKIDDGFWSHPKVLELSADALALWVRAGSYCAGHLTDGEVKRGTLRLLGADRDAATELVLAGLWDHDGDRWLFHDWMDYQPTRESVEAERVAARERMRSVRANKPRTFASSSATPTRPDPYPTSKEVEGKPLSPFCRYHPDGTDTPCKGCANARLSFEAKKTAEKNKPTPAVRRAPECEKHPGYPLPCDRCKTDS